MFHRLLFLPELKTENNGEEAQKMAKEEIHEPKMVEKHLQQTDIYGIDEPLRMNSGLYRCVSKSCS